MHKVHANHVIDVQETQLPEQLGANEENADMEAEEEHTSTYFTSCIQVSVLPVDRERDVEAGGCLNRLEARFVLAALFLRGRADAEGLDVVTHQRLEHELDHEDGHAFVIFFFQ